MADNDGVITRSPSEDTTVTDMVLDVADNSSFGDGSEGKDVADDEGGLLTAVDELAGVDSFGGDEQLRLLLVPEWVAERDLGEWRASTGVVDDVGDNTLEVTVALAEVEAAEPGWALAVVSVGLEDGPSTLTLCSDDSSHGGESKALSPVPAAMEGGSERIRVF